ncbi:MAG: protein kinase [Planctomycetaceae bacterium]|nr:protein kinase [Planctomycetaceae bacterium]
MNATGPQSPRSAELLNRVARGDGAAEVVVYERYSARLLALAEQRLGNKFRARASAEDVTQSAWRSFFLHSRGGRFETSQAGDLWRLLAKITMHKLGRQLERHTAAKRDVRQEFSTEPAAMVERQPAVVDVVAAAELLQLALADLPTAQRGVIEGVLAGLSLEQLATQSGRSVRTARRLLQQARQTIEDRLQQPSQDIVPKTVWDRVGTDNTRPLLHSDDYRLHQMIGAGAMGRVFRATELSTQRTVAVKALRKHWQSDVRAVERFVHEAQTLLAIEHPGVTAVTGLGQFPAGGLFLVCEYVDGPNLQTRLAERRFALARAAELMNLTAQAVEHVHRCGVVHCDLKPANILLRPSGEPVVTDFGFAWSLRQDPAAALSVKSIGGTSGYVAPEVLAGQPPSPAADVYAVGVLAWQLVSASDLWQKPGNLSAPMRTWRQMCLKWADAAPDNRPALSDVCRDLARFSNREADCLEVDLAD